MPGIAAPETPGCTEADENYDDEDEDDEDEAEVEPQQLLGQDEGGDEGDPDRAPQTGRKRRRDTLSDAAGVKTVANMSAMVAHHRSLIAPSVVAQQLRQAVRQQELPATMPAAAPAWEEAIAWD